MRNYIILNNQNSNTISGLIIQELAPISKPLQRTQVETIDGRDGDIVTPLGYAAYDKKITIGLYGDFDINEIIAYFATQGTAIFSNEPDKYYNYQILDQIDYERLVRFRVATVTMHVQPFKYSATEGTLTIDASDTVSGEGSDIALDGTAESPFTTLRHKGNATQTTYSGKNLCPNPLEYGIYDLNGAKSGSDTGSVRSTTQLKVAPSTQYIFSCNGAKINTWIYEYDANGAYISGTRRLIQQTSFTTGSTTHFVTFFKGSDTGLTGYQLELGSTPTSYEPYVGGIPSPNPDYSQDIQVVTGEQTVKITGKNLFNPHDMVKGRTDNGVIGYESGTTDLSYTDNSISFTTGTTYRGVVSGLIHAQPSTEYHFKATTSDAVSRFVDAYDTAGAWISRLTTSASGMDFSFTTPSNCGGVRISFQRPTVGSATLSDLMLELGSTATAYTPYQGQEYVIPFGDTYLAGIGNYADEPVKVGDTWYIRRAIGKVVLIGAAGENWQYANGVCYTDSITDYSRSNNKPLSDNFTTTVNVASAGSVADNTSAFGGANLGTQNRFYVKYTSLFSSVATIKTWLSTHNTTVYYALATPTDEEITDQDLIDALDEFYGQAHSYKGHTHIAVTAEDGNAPAILSVEVGEDNEGTVTNAGNTASRPILTIYGQGNIGVYINDVEVLDIALGNEQYITLDSTEMDAYKDSPANLKNRLVTGDYSKLALNAGANKIRFTGNVTKYEISKYSRWL